ncbi:MAG: hypothetical protein OEO23_08410, partial [Gemmatimonadota bacterium]|nr:hypothetical protein [Gemmatimonadota bacterium]
MDLDLSTESPRSLDTPLLVIPITQESGVLEGGPLQALDQHLGGGLTRGHAVGDFKGRTKDRLLLYGQETGPARVLLLGVGKEEDLDAHALR